MPNHCPILPRVGLCLVWVLTSVYCPPCWQVHQSTSNLPSYMKANPVPFILSGTMPLSQSLASVTIAYGLVLIDTGKVGIHRALVAARVNYTKLGINYCGTGGTLILWTPHYERRNPTWRARVDTLGASPLTCEGFDGMHIRLERALPVV